MTWDVFWDLVNRIGPWAALLLAALWASMTGRFRWSREFAQAEKETEQLRKDYDRQLAEMTRDRDYYRDMTMELIQRYDREVQTSEAAVGTAVRALRRRS